MPTPTKSAHFAPLTNKRNAGIFPSDKKSQLEAYFLWFNYNYQSFQAESLGSFKLMHDVIGGNEIAFKFHQKSKLQGGASVTVSYWGRESGGYLLWDCRCGPLKLRGKCTIPLMILSGGLNRPGGLGVMPSPS